MADDRQYHLHFDGSKAAAVEDYLEYKRIVGDDDGGKPFTPDEYEEYKKKVLPMRMKNRIFTSWTSSTGMDCKMIGPETNCFCQHRYRQHKTDFEEIPSERPILMPCRERGCPCVSYHYVPKNGSQPIRCSACKHPATEHGSKPPYQCEKSICQKCAGFRSSHTCSCGEGYSSHHMTMETANEREGRGHPVGRENPYQAMGGLTGFSSLADGYMRLDPSGRGAPDEQFLDQAITANDNAFLKANVSSIQGYRKSAKHYDQLVDDLPERMSALRAPGEGDDMDYFERRYQERMKAEKAAKRGIAMQPSERPRTGQRGTTSAKSRTTAAKK